MRRWAAACAAGLLLLPGIVHSQSDSNWMFSIYTAPPLDEMVGESSMIAIGVSDSSWVEMLTGMAIPITIFSFRIEEVLYCEPLVDSLRSLTVGCPGGRDPRTGAVTWIPHAARLNTGTRQVVFLQKMKDILASEDHEHFTVTRDRWGISGITQENVLIGGSWDGHPLEVLRAWIAEAAFAKSHYSLLNRADALVKAQIGPSQVVPRPDSTLMRVTSVTVVEWLKGEGGKVISLHEDQTIRQNTTWKDRAYLPEAKPAMIFLEKFNGAWRVLDGPNGLFCIASDGSLFHHQNSRQIRYIGIKESELRADLQLDTTDK